MHNKNEFNKKLKDFIGSDKRMALVKGYINEYKLTTVLRALNNSDYTKGTIHTRSIGNLKQIVDNRIIPKNITQNTIFKLSNLTLEVKLLNLSRRLCYLLSCRICSNNRNRYF